MIVACPDTKTGSEELLNDSKFVYTALTRAKRGLWYYRARCRTEKQPGEALASPIPVV